MTELLLFLLLKSDSCGIVKISPTGNFIIENNIVMRNFPFNEYPLKDNCSEMANYPKIFKSGNDIIFIKDPNKEYFACYFKSSPDECEILEN